MSTVQDHRTRRMKVVICQGAGMIVRKPSNSFIFYFFFKCSHDPLDQEWKHSCYLHCLAPVLDAISQPSLDYGIVIQLDKQIRDFLIPDLLRDKNGHSRSIIMQKASLLTALEASMSPLPIVKDDVRLNSPFPQYSFSSIANSLPGP